MTDHDKCTDDSPIRTRDETINEEITGSPQCYATVPISDISAEMARQEVIPSGGREPKQIVVPFDRFDVGVMLDQSDHFIGISYIGIRKQFIRDEKAKGPKGYHDVDSLFPPEPEEE